MAFRRSEQHQWSWSNHAKVGELPWDKSRQERSMSGSNCVLGMTDTLDTKYTLES